MEFIQGISVLLMSVVFHEYAHGWVAYQLGDPTAKRLGRLTLNPLKHIDPIGSILVPVMLKLLRIPFVFGWAKPVPINFSNLHNPKRDMIWVAIAGAATNVILALLCSLILKWHISVGLDRLLTLGIVINLVLAVFNLIPIPPLDGSRIVSALLPKSLSRQYNQFERYGFIILIVLLNLGLLDFIWLFVLFLAKELGVTFG